MRIEEIPITAITPYKNNARNNSKTIEKVQESIEKYGFKVPLVIDENYVIIAGHTRFEALKRINEATGKYQTVPCNVVRLNDDLAKEYRIVDNKISDLSEWDTDKLTLELKTFATADEIAEEFNSDISSIVEQSYGSSIKPVTQEDVEREEEKLNERYEVSTKAAEESLVVCRCAYCQEEFTLRKEDLK